MAFADSAAGRKARDNSAASSTSPLQHGETSSSPPPAVQRTPIRDEMV
jgi:hypothetical protein